MVRPDTLNVYPAAATTNIDTVPYTLYAWAEVPGYSKFSEYQGNGFSDGTFVYCGFKPALVIIKCRNTTNTNWVMYDNFRDPDVNPVDLALFPNLDVGQSSQVNGNIDFLATGFKLRGAGAATNASGSAYVFAAWADMPSSGGTNNPPAPAR